VDTRPGGSCPYRFEEPGWIARSAYSPRVRRERRRVSSFALSLLLVRLLTNLSLRLEVYANPEYGFSMLALFGAAGLFVYWVFSNLIMVVQNPLIYGLPRSGKQAAP
jgi:hypothetical protein